MIASKSSAVALFLVSVLGASALGCKKGAADSASQSAPPVQVTTAQVTQTEAPLTLRLPGTLRGSRETDLAANAAGRVVATQVERGQQVKAGQVLAQLDVRAAAISAAEANAQAASAKAQASQLESECARYEQLKAKGAVTALEYDRMASQCRTSSFSVAASAARARMAAQNIGDGSVRAPFAGIVTDRYVEVGEFVRQDSKVLTLVSSDELRLEFAVPEADAPKVREGTPVTFKVAAFPEREFAAKVKFKSGAIRVATRDLVVEAVVDNPDKALMPGMFADVAVAVGTATLAAVPKAAVFQKEGRPRAFVVVDGRLEERVLAPAPGAPDASVVAITKGAKPGDAVALGDHAKLSNGQRVAN